MYSRVLLQSRLCSPGCCALPGLCCRTPLHLVHTTDFLFLRPHSALCTTEPSLSLWFFIVVVGKFNLYYIDTKQKGCKGLMEMKMLIEL